MILCVSLVYFETLLTHWGRVTHICVGKLTIICSDNGLSPYRRSVLKYCESCSKFIPFHSRNALNNFVCEMAAILSRPLMLLMCWFQWRLLLMVTPKYSVLSWVLRAWPSMVYRCLILFSVAFVTDRMLHLLMLNAMPQVLLHWTRLSRSLWRALQSDL